jgi:hypothetical protein
MAESIDTRGAESLLSLQRLEAAFSRHQGEFQRTRDDVNSFGSELANLKTGVQSSFADLRASVNALTAKLDEKSKTNWPAVALAISMVPAVWLFVTTYTQNAIAPSISATAINAKAVEQQASILSMLQQSSASSAAADVASRTDRGQLNDRMRGVENDLSKEIADRRSFAAEMVAKQIEIETQFCEQGHIINLMHANDLRNTAILYHKVTGDTYPTDNAYYPVVCRQPVPIGNHG